MAERELPAPEEPETDAQREVGVSNIAVQIHTKGLRDTGADNRSALVDASAQTSLPDAPPETPSKDEFQEVVSTDVDVAAKPQLESKQLPRPVTESRTSFAEVSLDGSANPVDTAETSRNHAQQHQNDEARSSRPQSVQQTPSYASSSASVSTRGPSDRSVSGATSHRLSRASTSTTYGSGKPVLQGVLVLGSFETILASKEAKRLPALKNATQTALDILKSPAHQGANGSAGAYVFFEDRRADVFEPLKLACETRGNALMITALDAIGKLVSYGFFNPSIQQDGHPPSEHQSPIAQQSHSGRQTPAIADGFSAQDEAFERDVESEKLSEAVVNTICGCFQEVQPGPATTALQATTTGPDAVNLQIVKVLLTLVLQESGGRGLSVHQSSLLQAVRTVYNIFLLSRSSTNQMVAQGALNQIVGSVFSRVRPDARLANSMFGQTQGKSSRGPSGTSSPAKRTTSARHDTDREATSSPITSNGHREVSATLADNAPGSSEEAGAERKMSSDKRASVETVRPSAAEEGEAVVNGGLDGGPTEANPPAVIVTADPDTQQDPLPETPALEAPVHITLSQLESDTSRADSATPAPTAGTPFFSLNELHTKDAYLVFRALCKLGIKPLGVESERDMKSHAMRSKLLSLHLVLSIIHNHLSIFVDQNVVIYSASTREFIPFLQAIKQYLLPCLSRNAVSPVLSVFELSCEIFWRIVSGLRTKLKKEIEVLLAEIFLPILEMRNSSVRQKAVLLNVFSRLCLDPQALVDFYINYDCDRTSLDNVYERLVNILSRIGTTRFDTLTPAHVKDAKNPSDLDSNAASTASWTSAMPFLPPIPINTSTSPETPAQPSPPSLLHPTMPVETQLKRQSLECLVSILRSLVVWTNRTSASQSATGPSQSSASHNHHSSVSLDGSESPVPPFERPSEDDNDRSFDASTDNIQTNGVSEETYNDDPGRFENAKQRKTTLLDGIKKFNFKPKRGISYLLETGFIRSRSPRDIAAFLLHADGLSKAMIGEYLGEGDPDSIATMHAFVDFMDFNNMRFVDALRMFLQSFRLPGEAQKIDRFMLKFAERYIAGNPQVFANADPAYILAFSTIMLNTDAHSPQIKRGRMTKAEFVKNNRGINNGEDLAEDFLSSIYDEIQINEIRMKDEVEVAPIATPALGLTGALTSVGRDYQREAYIAQSEGMVSKTDALFKTMVKTQRRGPVQRDSEVFFSASHIDHIKPMFEIVWTPILAGISAPLQVTDEANVVERCLEGFRLAVKIVCLFDLELERNAFVTTLSKLTSLMDFAAMKRKNVEAIRCLLDIAAINGNYLRSSWREVLFCISQLERFQLITQGVDSRSLPELGRKHSTIGRTTTNASKRQQLQAGQPTELIAKEATASHITNAADRVFSSSGTLSGTAIVEFVQALSDVSWEEIQSSGLAEQPRVFCLQKLVEISYYNMGRIRLEWSQMWAILGNHFNQVCCHTNASVSFLALDSLRQLAMRFLEKQELANFSFQKDFLKPFEYAMIHNNNPDIRDMILQCMQQMLQARVGNLRSGWRTMFGVFCAASKVLTERVANQAFDIVKRLNKDHFGLIVTYGSFADLAVCITDFCKISKYQKISLHAIEMLRNLIVQMLRAPECPITPEGPLKGDDGSTDDPMTRYWFPVLFGFYDIIMNGEDLEVRKRALDYLFETLKTHGHSFPPEFWDSVCKEVLFPIFSVLRSRSDVSRLSTHEDMSVWLSTTMIQALRDLVDLFAHYFDTLVRMLDQLLSLLVECICQENDTLARIGTSCLQQLLEKNVRKLTPELWEKIVSTFVQLFHTTTAGQLFDENLRAPIDPDAPEPPSVNGGQAFINTPLEAAPEDSASRPLGYSERRRIFRQIIVKCVLQLLLIETAHDLLQNDEVYSTIPPADLLRLMAELDKSYRFAKRFNADKELRMALWKVGFMKQLPNLLKQESNSAATLVSVLLRMYGDERPDHVAKRKDTLQAFLPLGVDILETYIAFDAESQARNIAAWSPVVVEVLQGICAWEDATLKENVSVVYPLAVDLMARELSQEVRESIRSVFHRVGLTLDLFQLDTSTTAGSVIGADSIQELADD